MSRLVTNPNPVDVLSMFENVNKPSSIENGAWQKILFSENVLRSTRDIWENKFSKINMQSMQVLILKHTENKIDVDKNIYFDSITTLLTMNKAFSVMTASNLRMTIKKCLNAVLEEDVSHYKMFASILSTACDNVPDMNLVNVVSDFIVANILCLTFYNSYYCAGKVSLASYKDAELANSVLRETCYGSYILQNVVAKNAKVLFELAAQTITGNADEEKPQEKNEKKPVKNTKGEPDELSIALHMALNEHKEEASVQEPVVLQEKTAEEFDIPLPTNDEKIEESDVIPDESEDASEADSFEETDFEDSDFETEDEEEFETEDDDEISDDSDEEEFVDDYDDEDTEESDFDDDFEMEETIEEKPKQNHFTPSQSKHSFVPRQKH